ncbi:hypothetical protein J5X84_39185 [Streptosporangiaceae bacterium NEAU-GS5]|nr:hypothetical protein [Streptosporangiaceae bacterium NEAU-GS5]
MSMEVYIPLSKTDPDAHGETVAIPYGSHPGTCPVRVTRALLAELNDRGITRGPLLRRIDRHGGIGHHDHAAAGRGHRIGLSPQAINLIVKHAALAAALERAEAYTAHGLRAGGATSAAKAGAPMSAITRQGRWADGSPVVAGYIRQPDKWNDNPHARHRPVALVAHRPGQSVAPKSLGRSSATRWKLGGFRTM